MTEEDIWAAAQARADELMEQCDDDRNYDEARLELAVLYADQMRRKSGARS